MPPDLSGQPLGELKQWLAISTPGEDALLLRLLATAWQVCLQFTGITATGIPVTSIGGKSYMHSSWAAPSSAACHVGQQLYWQKSQE